MSVMSARATVREDDFERHRAQLTRHCARLLRSPSEAEDAVQETLLRAWRSHSRFEGRSGLYSWLYRIATNVCMDMLKDRSRRPVPFEATPLQSDPIEPCVETDPAEQALARETFRLALVAALERLPARQRAVLLLREVLCWRASEVAELLGTSIPAVNSALQRARTALEAGAAADSTAAPGCSREELLGSYLSAFPGAASPVAATM
jgi:RNA polymerase sigma-70 factor, ECF subfamily